MFYIYILSFNNGIKCLLSTFYNQNNWFFILIVKNTVNRFVSNFILKFINKFKNYKKYDNSIFCCSFKINLLMSPIVFYNEVKLLLLNILSIIIYTEFCNFYAICCPGTAICCPGTAICYPGTSICCISMVLNDS